MQYTVTYFYTSLLCVQWPLLTVLQEVTQLPVTVHILGIHDKTQVKRIRHADDNGIKITVWKECLKLCDPILSHHNEEGKANSTSNNSF